MSFIINSSGQYMRSFNFSGMGNIILSGETYISQYQTVYDSFSTKPDTDIATEQNTLVSTLVGAGIWDKMDLFYVFANDASDNAMINWINPGTYTAAENVSGTLDFTSYEGFTGNGTNYINTGFNPATANGKYSFDSANMFHYLRKDEDVSIYRLTMGVRSGSSISHFFWDSSRTSVAVRLHQATSMNITTSGSKGLFTLSRESSTDLYAYENNSLLNSGSYAAQPLPSANMTILARGNDAYPSYNQVSVAGLGEKLSANDVSILSNAIETYMISIFTSEYQTIYNSYSTKPTIAVAIEQDRLVKTLVNEGIWNKMDLFYVFANDNSTNALINWANPGTFDVPSAAPFTFTTYEGFAGNDLDIMSTNFNLLTDGINYTNESAALGTYIRLDTAFTDIQVGATDGSTTCWIEPRSNLLSYYRINQGSPSATVTLGDIRGMHIASRRDAGYMAAYLNNSIIATTDTSAGGVPNTTLEILGYNGGFQSSNQISLVFASSNLIPEDVSILTTAFETYMDSNGKGVIT